MKKNKQSWDNNEGSKIKVFNELASITGVGEEWLLRANGEVGAVFINGCLRTTMVAGLNKNDVTKPSLAITKKDALSRFLKSGNHVSNDGFLFEDLGGGNSYLVLTNEEADERAAEAISDSLWAFEDWFIMKHTNLSEEEVDLIKNNGRCESNNKIIKKLINDYEALVKEAIEISGRGHFLSTYNGNEYMVGNFFIYKLI